MATVIRIKRRLDEEPTENICIKSKKARMKEPDRTCEPEETKASAVLIRLGTVKSKEEPLEPLVIALRKRFKKLGSDGSYKEINRAEAKKRAVTKRYKIVTQSRGIGELPPQKDGLDASKMQSEEETLEGAEAMPSSSEDFSCFDAVLANDRDDIITCNGIPMTSEKYVYDIFYSAEPVDWADVMECNTCEIEKEILEELCGSDDDDDDDEDDDDENCEANWRNDYPDYDDSPYEDEEDYLNAQIKKLSRKKYDSDESYDAEDYDDDSFDEEGNLILTSGPASLSKLLRKTHLKDSESEDGDDSEEEVF